VSDLAPYASMVQRFGRVNRKASAWDAGFTGWTCRWPYDPAEVAVAGMLGGM